MNLVIGIALALVGASGWQTYTNTNFVNDIAGSDSLLVVATRGGVYAFDPQGLQILRTIVNSDGLPANLCNAVALDPAGNAWVATAGGGVGVIPRDSTRGLAYRPNDMPEVVTCVGRDGDRLLFGSDRGLYVVETFGSWLDFNDDLVRRYTVAGQRELLSDRVLSVAVLGEYWVGTNVGVTRVDTGLSVWHGFRRPLGDSVKAIAAWRDTLLVATEQGVARFRDTSFVPVFRFSPARKVFDLEVSEPDIYVATDTGLYHTEGPDSSRLRLIAGGDSRAVFAGQRLWVGLGGSVDRGNGLRYSISGQSWQSFSTGGIASGLVTGVAFSPVTGDLFSCHFTSYRGLSRIDPLTGGVALKAGVTGLALQAAADSRGRVWFAHFAADGGLSWYDPAEDKWTKLQWGASSGWNIIDAFGIDRHDTKWVFNADGVVVAVDSAGEQVEFDVPGLAPPPGGGYDFATDRRGRAWLGLTVGLVRIDYAGTLLDRSDDRYSVLTEGLPSKEVRSVAVDADDNVWAATPQGAAVYDGSRFRVFTTGNSGLLSNNVYRVRADASGRMWLLTDAGLSVYDPVSGRWIGYTPQNSGLPANIEGVNGFYTALAIDQDRGRVAVGTLRGLSLLSLGTDSAATDAASLRVYPNPCVLGTHSRVVIDSLPDNVRVEVRTLGGKLVAEPVVDQGLHRAVWRPVDVASGIYLLVVRGPLGSHVARVAVIRP
jgi:ligand-binding sensor domain-containing protein